MCSKQSSYIGAVIYLKLLGQLLLPSHRVLWVVCDRKRAASAGTAARTAIRQYEAAPPAVLGKRKSLCFLCGPGTTVSPSGAGAEADHWHNHEEPPFRTAAKLLDVSYRRQKPSAAVAFAVTVMGAASAVAKTAGLKVLAIT